MKRYAKHVSGKLAVCEAITGGPQYQSRETIIEAGRPDHSHLYGAPVEENYPYGLHGWEAITEEMFLEELAKLNEKRYGTPKADRYFVSTRGCIHPKLQAKAWHVDSTGRHGKRVLYFDGKLEGNTTDFSVCPFGQGDPDGWHEIAKDQFEELVVQTKATLYFRTRSKDSLEVEVRERRPVNVLWKFDTVGRMSTSTSGEGDESTITGLAFDPRRTETWVEIDEKEYTEIRGRIMTEKARSERRYFRNADENGGPHIIALWMTDKTAGQGVESVSYTGDVANETGRGLYSLGKKGSNFVEIDKAEYERRKQELQEAPKIVAGRTKVRRSDEPEGVERSVTGYASINGVFKVAGLPGVWAAEHLERDFVITTP